MAMALFAVRHQHDAAHCPASDADMGAMLLNHLSRPNVRSHGVTIQGEAVVQGEHTLYMIVESTDEIRVPRVHGALRSGRHCRRVPRVDFRNKARSFPCPSRQPGTELSGIVRPCAIES